MNTSRLEAGIDRISLVIRFNWAEILFHGFFITYGFFGAASPSLISFLSHPLAGIFQITLLSFFLVLLGNTGWKWGKDFEYLIVISQLITLFALSKLWMVRKRILVANG